jgi:Rap1a immunity proteins
MKGSLGFLALAWLMFFAAPSHCQPSTLSEDDKGSSLFHACQAAVRSMDAADGGTDADASLTGRCIDYTEGVSDGVVSLSPRSLCPGNASVGTMIRVYVIYMQGHPKLLDERKHIGLLNAWIEAYPCTKTHK